jgi:hypothetical protein
MNKVGAVAAQLSLVKVLKGNSGAYIPITFRF